MILEPWNPGPSRSLNTCYPQHPCNIDTTVTGEEGGGVQRDLCWWCEDHSTVPSEPRHPGFGAQGRLRISVDVVGSGWSEGKRMSVRVTRKMGHPRRPRGFGRDLPCSGNTCEEVGQGGREAGGGVKQNVRESVLGRVRRVKEGMCC